MKLASLIPTSETQATGVASVESATPDSVRPDWSAPWMDLFTSTQGLIMATILALLAILGVIGAGVWVAGKLSGTGKLQDAGLPMVLCSVVGAVLTVVIGGAIMWASGEADGWFDF